MIARAKGVSIKFHNIEILKRAQTLFAAMIVGENAPVSWGIGPNSDAQRFGICFEGHHEHEHICRFEVVI